MLELILASGNAHKADEFAELFNPKLVSVKAAVEKIEVVENGETYFENAFLKRSEEHTSDSSHSIASRMPSSA